MSLPLINLRKDIHSKTWRATSRVVLNLTNDQGHPLVLNITTSKRSSGELVTGASVCSLDRGFETHTVFQDYNKALLRTNTRCTEKAVLAQHNAALADYLDTVLAQVKTQYAKVAA